MKAPRVLRCVFLGAMLAAACGVGPMAWAQRNRSSGKPPAEPVPSVELSMPSPEPSDGTGPSGGSVAPPWQRPMSVPGVSSSPVPSKQTDSPRVASMPAGPNIQIDVPDPTDKGKSDKSKTDKAKADKAKADKAKADKSKKPSAAARLAKSTGSAASGGKSTGSAASGTTGATANSSPLKKTWLGPSAWRGPDEPESGSFRDRVRRARSDSRDRTASLPPQTSANLR